MFRLGAASSIVDDKAVIACTASRIGGRQLTHLACRSLERVALTRLHQPAIQTMRPGHGHRARRLHPAEQRWNLHSWQVSCCQAGCIRAAQGRGYTSLHEAEP